jgi:phosphoenolpyruvate synthase/pyruvate phosphate dikinase
MNIFWLGEPACNDVALVGDKAAILSQLSAAHHVPAGFCVTVSDLTRAKEDEDGAVTLQTALAGAYQILGQRWGSPTMPVIVRPSSTGEQTGAQRESYLANGIDELLAAADRCFQAARAEHLLTGRPMTLATVLVQPLVAADITVWLHSVNPASGNQQEIVVEAAWGLPDRILGCEVGRDTFVLDKNNLTVLAQTITDKRQMVLALPGGPREVKVPHYLRQQVVLNLGQVVEAASLALALAGAMGQPVEAECAYQDKTLYLLRCGVARPLSRTAGRSTRFIQQAMTLLAL